MWTPPQTLNIGPFSIYFYSLFILLGITAGYFQARPAAKRVGISDEQLQLSILFGVIPGIIGARLYHVIDKWSYYHQHLGQVFAIWNGGLGILGGLAAGVLGLWFFCRQEKIPFLKLLDVWAPSALLGQAIGRFGNWTNQEAFGPPTSLPWKTYISPEHRPSQYINDQFFHPTYFYEAGWDLLGVLVLIWLRRRFRLKAGQLLGAYLVIYSLGRFGAEFFRFDTARVGTLPVAHLLTAVLFVTGTHLIQVRRRHT